MNLKRLLLVFAVWIVASFGLLSWLLYGVTEVEAAFEQTAPGQLRVSEEGERQARRNFHALVETNPIVLSHGGTNRHFLTNQFTIGTNAPVTLATMLREEVTVHQANAAQVNLLTNWATWFMASQPARSATDLKKRIWIGWVVWTFVPMLGLITWRTLRSPSSQ